MSVEQLVDSLFQVSEGELNHKDIQVFSLTTCMWCRKLKRFLNDKKLQYKYLDLDKVDRQDKAKILEYLEKKFNTRVNFPFITCENNFLCGFNPVQIDNFLNHGE